MPRSVTLPSGFTVVLREPRELKLRHRKNAMKSLGLSGGLDGNVQLDYGDVANRLGDAVLTAAIVSWNVQALNEHSGAYEGDILLVPANDPVTLDELSIEDVKALEAETADLKAALLPDFGPSPDEKSPTPPSAD